MSLDNTTTLAPGDAAKAESLFKAQIDKKDTINVIVFGNDATAQEAINNANIRAAVAPAGFPRHAIWMQDPTIWPACKKHLKNGSMQVDHVDTANTIAIGCSLSNKLETSVASTQVPDLIVMELAFVQASKA